MDPYKILGITKNATPDEIRRAYRMKAAQYHPDKGGDAWIFQQIQDAYDELTGKKKKKRKTSQAKPEQPQSQPSSGPDPFDFDIPETQPNYNQQYRQPKSKRKKQKAIPIWAVIAGVSAAAVLIIGAALFFLLSMLNGNKDEQVADNSSEQSKTEAKAEGEVAIAKIASDSAPPMNSQTPIEKDITNDPSLELPIKDKLTNSLADSELTDSPNKPKPIQEIGSNGPESQADSLLIAKSKSEDSIEADQNQSTELLQVTEIQDPVAPSLTGDGLSIFYGKWQPGGSAIYTAQRRDVESLFQGEKLLFEGMQPTVTADGLEMVFVGKSPNSKGHEWCFFSTSRDSVGQPFKRPKPILELNDSSNTVAYSKNPCLSSDGLTIYFNEYPREGMTRFAFSTRRDRKSQWSRPRPLELSDVGRLTGLTCPFVTADGLTLFCVTEHGDMYKDGENVFRFTRSNKSEAFGNPEAVHIEGLQKFIGRYPRYVSATKELFFLQSDGKTLRNSGIVIARPFEVSTTNLNFDRSNSDTGNDRDYSRINDSSLPRGFVRSEEIDLFNGKNLEGWSYVQGNDKLARSKVWTINVDEEILRCAGKTDMSKLVSDERYEDFILNLEWRIPQGVEISKDGCGILVRARDDFSKSVAYQLTDGPNAASWLIGQSATPVLGTAVKQFKNRLIINPSKPKRAIGEWNTLKMVCAGSDIVIHQNGKRVLQLSDLETDAGSIALRSQGTVMEFRHVSLTPLEKEDDARDQNSEFVSLFNGKNLQQWNGDPRYWRVVDGTIVGKKPRNSGGDSYAATKQTFNDFVLKLKFKLNSGDSGIQFRGELSSDFTMSGNHANLSYENNLTELAWLYMDRDKASEPTKSQRRALANSIKKSDWNDYAITAVGEKIKLEINGIVVADVARTGPKEGSIGFQLHGSGADVAFKDIFVKEVNQPQQSSLVGTFDVQWIEVSSGNKGTVEYTFLEDGTVLKAGNRSGAWLQEGDKKYRIVYAQKDRGEVEITFTDRDSFNGLHRWAKVVNQRDLSRWVGERK